MSTNEIILEINKLLEYEWNEDDKILLKRLSETILSYKLLISKTLKEDIKSLVTIANRIKHDHNELKESITCSCKLQVNDEINNDVN